MKWYQKSWVIILLIIFIWPIGLIMMWSQKKFSKPARIILTGLILVVCVTGCGSKSNSSTSTSSVDNKDEVSTSASVEKTSNDKKAKTQEMETKYEPVLSEGKDYADMTDEESDIANELISNWNKLSKDFKSKYSNAKSDLDTSIKNYNEAKAAEEESASYDTGITYNQLARTPDDYKGKKVKFTGKVIQVVEDKKEVDLRIAVDGNMDTVLLVAYKPNITKTRVLENDNVTIKGESGGIWSYDATNGAKVSLPIVHGKNIEIN